MTTFADTTPGTRNFTVPAGVFNLVIEVWGAGAKGGAGVTSGKSVLGGTGGSGAAYSKRNSKAVSPGDLISYTIGAGMTTWAASTAAGLSSCDGMTANGGATPAILTGSGAAGGTATGGDVNTSGSSGGTSGGISSPGDGGASPNGGGTASGIAIPGNPPGGGGSGSISILANSGGNGADGKILITYTAGASSQGAMMATL